MMKKHITGLGPVIDKKARVLILGSIPGEQSLEKKKYYANERNHFWEIISQVLGKTDPGGYRERKKLLHDSKIALWDVIMSCSREGSSDDTIQSAKPNDIRALLKKYPKIKAIFLNGETAYKIFKENFADVDIPFGYLTSTSSLNTQRMHLKIEEWKSILNHLD
ncbi:MAG: DNA-deoxyinosine glycosylase [Candidatus Omnitrophota bacterium]|jgi:TDG/mug DNA glycosylase family protein